MIDQKQIDEWRKLCENATPLPWRLWGMQVMADPDGSSDVDKAIPVARTMLVRDGRQRTFDADFIAAARTALPQLLDEVERIKSENKQLKRKLGERDATP